MNSSLCSQSPDSGVSPTADVTSFPCSPSSSGRVVPSRPYFLQNVQKCLGSDTVASVWFQVCGNRLGTVGSGVLSGIAPYCWLWNEGRGPTRCQSSRCCLITSEGLSLPRSLQMSSDMKTQGKTLAYTLNHGWLSVWVLIIVFVNNRNSSCERKWPLLTFYDKTNKTNPSSVRNFFPFISAVGRRWQMGQTRS